MRLDLDKIKEELELLPEFDGQICLQGVKDVPDPFFGCGAIKIGTSPPYGPWKKETWPGYREKDFTHPNFDLPYTNSILEELPPFFSELLKTLIIAFGNLVLAIFK